MKCDIYNVILEEDVDRIDFFEDKSYKRLELFGLAKADEAESMIWYPGGKYITCVGSVPTSYYGAIKNEAVLFEMSGTNILTQTEGFAGGCAAPMSGYIDKEVLDTLYITMKTESNMIKAGSAFRVYAYYD